MDRNFPAALRLVLKHEGGYVNHPNDPGGPTNKGITLATYRKFVKPNATIADLKAISDADVASVYRLQYWAKVQGDRLPAGLDYAVFDFGVNSGPKRAAEFLQAVLGVAVDGQIGPATLEAANRDPAKAIAALCDRRLAWLQGLPTWPTFKKGWTARVKAVKAEALKWAKAGAQEPAKPAPGSSEIPNNPLPAPDPDKRPNGLIGGLIAASLASLTAALVAAQCSMPDWFINWAGYAAKCMGGQ